ncbi:U32 family peptidase [Alkaliphilus serpentinus]|uniref:U32 family peptidase n=1 Tax=Alkaliphilus serpentinus TaxID=1482731 RepID=A0A833HNL4_9FIRM|nr:U32 family peptidase [Alkaliphilus serpentinus]KAB3529807.1 U32 family peptidase [Alkaliphilus serpentinus]
MTIELLAPAGSYEALKAALQSGADAVYLGGQAFNARAYASNFDRETLKEAVEYAHIRDMKVYVTINTLIKDFEMNHLLDYVAYLYSIDVDALIIQDIGVLSVVSKAFPDFELHASTQMTLHNSYGVEMVKELGIKRVVLAREVPLNEIKEIHRKTGVEIEIFVHGALCVSYSGQCLMSSFIGGRSGNRGRCAQPCRRSYQLLSAKKSTENAYHLSMRDLNTLQQLDQLIDSGVSSLKIEGRMKKPEYVASIVRNYRRAIDEYLKVGSLHKNPKAEAEMEQIFNRKFTKGYILGSSYQEVINTEKPGNRGVFIGKVKALKGRNRISILLEKPLSKGDGIEIHGAENIGGLISAIYINQKQVEEGKAGDLVDIEIKGNMKIGDRVFKTHDVHLIKELQETYRDEGKKIKISGEATITLDETMKLYIWDDAGNTLYKESSFIVERAKNQPITEERVRENLNKLGNTPYLFKELNIHLEEGVAVPISVINSLRREAIDELSNIRKNRNKRRKVEAVEFISHKSEGLSLKASPDIAVRVDNIDKLQALQDHRISRIYYGDINTLLQASNHCKEEGWQIYYRSSNIMREENNKEYINKIKNIDIDGIMAGDLSGIYIATRILKIPVVADYTINPFNSPSLEVLKAWGVKGVVLSPELDLKGLGSISLPDGIEAEVMAYGRLPVMTVEYCPLGEGKECNNLCHSCSIKTYSYNWYLKDEKKIDFPFGKDSWGRTIILNSQPLYMLDKLKDLKKLKPAPLNLSITTESPQEIGQLMEAAFDSSGDKKPAFIKEFTRGHYYRGVE